MQRLIAPLLAAAAACGDDDDATSTSESSSDIWPVDQDPLKPVTAYLVDGTLPAAGTTC